MQREERAKQTEDKGDGEARKKNISISCAKNLADLVAFAKTVNYQMETSELYKMNGHYYLTILVDVEEAI